MFICQSCRKTWNLPEDNPRLCPGCGGHLDRPKAPPARRFPSRPLNAHWLVCLVVIGLTSVGVMCSTQRDPLLPLWWIAAVLTSYVVCQAIDRLRR